MTGVGPHPLCRGLLVCNWGLEGPLSFQRVWAWDRVVVGPGHRCGGESPALPLMPTGPQPALRSFGLSFATCEGKISVSALPCNLTGRLCRQDKFSSSQGELRQRLSPRECNACVFTVVKDHQEAGVPAGQAGRALEVSVGPAPRGTGQGQQVPAGRGGGTVPMAPGPGQASTGWPHQPLGPSPSPPSWRGRLLSVQAAVRLVS